MNSPYFANAKRYAPAYFDALPNKNITVLFLINEIEMSVLQTKSKYKLEKCRHLSQAFSLSAKVGLDRELNLQFHAGDWLV